MSRDPDRPGNDSRPTPAAATPPWILPSWAGPVAPLPPILIGDTGRSGAPIAARILGAHPDRWAVPFEVRFLSEPGGLCDLVDGRTSVRQFDRRLVGRWFDAGPTGGLHLLVDRATLGAAVRELGDGLEGDAPLAAARFSDRLLGPATLAAGALGWIDTTPASMRAAPTLARIFPGLRLIHVVRDGRDVACAVLPPARGFRDLDRALGWWATAITDAFIGLAGVPDDVVRVVALEALVSGRRDAEVDGLLAVAGLSDCAQVRAAAGLYATPERAMCGRWRAEVPAAMRPVFEARYREIVRAFGPRDWPYRPDDDVPTAATPHATPGPSSAGPADSGRP